MYVIIFCVLFIVGYFLLSFAHHVSRVTNKAWSPAQVVAYTIATPFIYVLFVLLAPLTAILFCVHVVESKK